MAYPDQVQWFDPLGACFNCGKPATGTLRGPRNESYGHACLQCAERRLNVAWKAREAETKATWDLHRREVEKRT